MAKTMFNIDATNRLNFSEKRKKTSARWNALSKVDVLGSFDFMTLTISLDSLNIDDYKRLVMQLSQRDYKDGLENRTLRFDLYEILTKFYGLSFHEYTHFIDSTSTVWGLKYLASLNDAYLTNHDIFGTPESEYHKAKYFFDLANSLRLPEYYTAITPGVDHSRPWSYQVTAGKRFDSRGHLSDIPVTFVSFDNLKHERIVRSPLSVVAILEVSAMAQEFLYKSFLVQALPEDQRIIEGPFRQNEALDFMYNHELTEYSACAHLVANMHGYKDVLMTYIVCEKISTIVLNLTDECFKTITFSETARKTLQIDNDKALADICQNSIIGEDRGYIFYVICLLMPKKAYETDEEIIDGISSALNNMGLDFYQIITRARREVEIMSDTLSKSPLHSLTKLSNSFLKNFDKKLATRNGMYSFHEFDLPPVLLGDCEVCTASPGTSNNLKEYDIEEAYNELVLGQLWVERFSEACM